jgi:predicted metal-dependent peptidase
MYKAFPLDEYYRFTRSLQKFHEIFASLWKITRPSFTDEIPTACVVFNEKGACIDFLINPDFWQKLGDDYNKEFVICHEMCHVALCHGVRQQPYLNRFSPDTLNVALDLAVNHLLTALYGFQRFAIKNWQDLCWADTVLKDLDLEPNKSFEFYIQQIEPHCKQINVSVVDHKYLSQFNGDANNKIRTNSNEVNKTLDKDKLKHVKSLLEDLVSDGGRSDDEADSFYRFTGDNIKYRTIKKWESVLKRAVAIGDKERERLQWIRTNRRIAYFDSDLLLPSDMETVEKEPYKYKVWLFLDYSGSCNSLKQPFFRASNTFDPKKFEVRKFAHCTQVQEFQGKSVSIPGYSTSFSCIERFIQKQIAKGDIDKYPDFIFSLTDGHGDNPEAEYPERWHVFLSTRSTSRHYKDKYNIYKLQDFIYETI